jgi:hypothetical protein
LAWKFFEMTNPKRALQKPWKSGQLCGGERPLGPISRMGRELPRSWVLDALPKFGNAIGSCESQFPVSGQRSWAQTEDWSAMKDHRSERYSR